MEDRLTVVPILQVIGRMNDTRVVHLTCNTPAEFEFALGAIPSRSPFGILSFAFHGCPGEVMLGDGTLVTLPDLAACMGRKFSSWVVHFGSCGTLRADSADLEKFMAETGVDLLLGYTKNVDWIDAAAMDLILFQRLQQYKYTRSMWSYVKKNYSELVRRTGLTIFPSG